MTKLSDIGERAAIEILARVFDRGQPIGLGHDVGVVDWGDEYLVVTTDVVNAKTHVPAGATPAQVGWYATAVNLSDIAASGARPLGFVAALSMPRDTEVEFLRGLAGGMEECVREFGIAVLGGDTKEADALSIAGTAFGRVRKDRILLRSGARPGDAIVITGDLGRAGHAMKMLETPGTMRGEALNQLLRPYPRIADGMFFSESGAVTSCMDLSDGLGASLAQMASMTKLSYQIEYDALPLYRGLASLPPAVAKDLALCSGGDYELLATVRPEEIPTVLSRYAETQQRERHRLTVVGTVAASGGNLLVTKSGKEPLLAKGWEHFRSSTIR
ncbi:MAG: thiamine-phosphate kinase [Thermoplasmata archaeon]|nr:thiamine-phosphate kinase [Thermoplasmata archaeon]